MSLCDIWSSDVYKKKWEAAQRNRLREYGGQGQWELKENVECLHIETDSLMQTDEQLMFEAAGGSNKGHVYGFASQSATITVEQQEDSNSSLLVPSVSSATAHESCIKS
ncbi:hypothetical protein M9H77_19625 [Catharanthus roseus]|uniref:Uncharacterized protein n=1 Tax=Catharanthus roseus TaxID=4058 RepID=A0ACC0BAY2_CATRO|nr:hypothetical protein M9H77_19625 [Catharanthus roseus]